MIKTFTSFHHANDQYYKDQFVQWAEMEGLIDNRSVATGDIDPSLGTQTIRQIIRDEYLRDSEVTIVLCGTHTRFRKHVDWEIKSSMINGRINRRSGILAITLPGSGPENFISAYPNESSIVYPDYPSDGWGPVGAVGSLAEKFPGMPRRVLENVAKTDVQISIVPWSRVFGYVTRLRFLLYETRKAAETNNYDLSRKMRMKNFNPVHETFDLRV